MNGLNKTNFTSINGLNDIYSDSITCSNINTSSLIVNSNDIESEINQNIANITNLQNQLNGITSVTSIGGGFFTLTCELTGFTTTASQYFSFGGSQTNTLGVLMPTCTLIAARFASTYPVSSGNIFFYIANGGSNLSFKQLNATSAIQTTGLSKAYVLGDTLKVFTSAGFGSYPPYDTTVQIRCSMVFSCNGIKGSDGISQTISIGTTNNLVAGSQATVSNVGTTTNQILNFGIPQGLKGDIGLTGEIGLTGATGSQGIQGEIGPQGYQGIQGSAGNAGINGTNTSLSIGTVTSLYPTATPTITNVGDFFNQILNFAIPRGYNGIQGDKGDRGDKGDQGEKGEKGDAPATVDAITVLGWITAAFGTLLTQVEFASLQSQVGIIDTALTAAEGEITVLQGEMTEIQGAVDVISTDVDSLMTKTLYQSSEPSTLSQNKKTKFNSDISITGLDPLTDVINLNSTGTSIFTKPVTFSDIVNINSIKTNTLTYGNTNASQIMNIGVDGNNTNTLNLNSKYINIGDTQSLNSVSIEASSIDIGVGTYLSNINIGNQFAVVKITSLPTTSISVGNFLDQFA